jgi:hypothetical protein
MDATNKESVMTIMGTFALVFFTLAAIYETWYWMNVAKARKQHEALYDQEVSEQELWQDEALAELKRECDAHDQDCSF